MSTIIIAIGILTCCAVVSLIIAIPLQTAGYNNHEILNEDLVETQCKVVEWLVIPNTCYRSCEPCYTSCVPRCTTTTVNSHITTSCTQSCSTHCQTCPYTCYDAQWRVQYSKVPQVEIVDPSSNSSLAEPVFTTVFPCGTKYGSTATAQGALSVRALDSTFACYYNSENVGMVVSSKYDVTAFYASYITFYVIAAMAGLGICGLLAVYLVSRTTREVTPF